MKPLTAPILMVGTPQYCLDIYYATGFTAPDPVVYLKTETQQYLVVSLLERERAKRTAGETCIISPDELRLGESRRRTD